MKPTIKDVAREAGVSIATVSMVINDKADRISDDTIDRVKQVIEKLNYTPNKNAQNLQKRKTNLIALLVPDLKNSFYTEIADSAIKAAEKKGYLLTLIDLPYSDSHKKRIYETFNANQFAGALVVSRKFDEDILILLEEVDLPYVLLDESIKFKDRSSLITGNNRLGGALVAEYFIKKGHRRLACITGPDNTPNSMKRLSGFVNEINKYGIILEKENIVCGNYTLEGGYEAGKELINKDITGIFAFNDLSAIGCINYFRENGKRIPEDISIIGYDHINISDYLFAKLTTVDQRVSKIGIEGVELLISKIDGKKTIGDKFIDPIFIEGETVKDLSN